MDVEKHVAASTQNQALSALLFLYQQVLDRKLDFIDKVERVKRPPKVPVAFTRAEAPHAIFTFQMIKAVSAETELGQGWRRSACSR